MKKVLIVSIIPMLMGTTFSVLAAEPEFKAPTKVTVDGGKINFTGTIVAAPCAVDVDNNGASVTLGQVATNKLVAKGDSSSAVPFSIKFVGCDLDGGDSTGETANYAKASITFNGTTAGDDSTLALSTSGSGENVAKNVGIQILQDSKPVKVDGSTASKEASIIAGNNEIPFSAAYVATADKVVAGTGNATVNFRVTYQ